jgi:hypothetical protein
MEKKKTKNDQSQRFEETARELGADESGEAFERAFGKIVPPKKPVEPKSAKEKSRKQGVSSSGSK